MPNSRNRRSTFQLNYKKYCKIIVSIVLILVICGLLAFGTTVVYFHLFEKSDHISVFKPQKWSLPSFRKNETLIKNLPPAATCGKRIVGYYTEWEPVEIRLKQLQKLTHVIYLFVAIYEEDGSARFWDENGKERFLTMKELSMKVNSGLKVMIGVGGYMVSPRFPPIASDSKKRKKLIEDITKIVDEYDLDGVEVFWIYPNEDNKRNYLRLIRELREKLSYLEMKKHRKEPYILSVVAPKFTIQLEDGYDLNRILEYVDFIDVLTYDYFHSIYSTEKQRYGPNSPIYGGNGRNVDETMKYLVCKTKQPNRFNIAVSFYGDYWKNVENPMIDGSYDIWKHSDSGVSPVRWRKLERDGWNKSAVSWHEESKSSYIWIPESKTFLGFENERSLKEKIKYAREKNIGGFVIWVIDQDDDEDTLLNVMTSAELCSEKSIHDVRYEC